MILRNPLGSKDTPTDSAGPPAETAAPQGMSGRILQGAVERALEVQQPLAAAYVGKLRRSNPSATPADIIATLGKQYTIAVGGTGAAAGGAALVPGIGTMASLATGAAEVIAVLDAAVLYTLAVAHVHGVAMDEVERRRAVVLTVLIGDGATKLIRKATGGSPHWANELVDHLPLPKLGALNNTLVRWFIRRWLTRQGALAVGRALPLGIGAVIGATGNVTAARSVIRSTEQAFGPPPATWPQSPGPE